MTSESIQILLPNRELPTGYSPGHCEGCRRSRIRAVLSKKRRYEEDSSVNLESEAKLYFNSHRSESNADQGAHIVLKTGSLVIFLLSESTVEYANLKDRQKRRRESALTSFISQLGMEVTDAVEYLLAKSSRAGDCLQKALTDPMSNLSKTLCKNGVPLPLTAKHAAALFLSRQFTENDILFVRRYFGAIPPLKDIVAAKWEFLRHMPSLYIMTKNNINWRCVGNGRQILLPKVGREVLCARVSLKDALKKQLSSLKEIGRWPHPPSLPFIPANEIQSTVVLLFSIDSGTGSLKQLARFVRETGTQNNTDIMLISEAHGVRECFEDFLAIYRPLNSELEDIKENGVVVEGDNIKVITMFTGDFKVLYSLLGLYGPSSSFLCPWCLVPRRYIDQSLTELESIVASENNSLTSTALISRPEMHNLINRPKSTHLQKVNTFNIFCLHKGSGTPMDPTNMVPPALHIKLGLINKILAALDGVVSAWNVSKKWQKTAEDTISPSMLLLARSLADIGVRRERYYTGALSGVPCTKLMQKMEEFCELFFHSPAGDWGTTLENLQSSVVLEEDLKILARIYNGTEPDGTDGFGYYMGTQKYWTDEMITQWISISEKFIKQLKKAIWRPSGKGFLHQDTERVKWLQPMMMPKLHCIAVHVTSFVKTYRYWALFSEEGFERFQQVSKRTRSKLTHNCPTGTQIFEDLQYSWLMCLPQVLSVQEKAEKERKASGFPIRKLEFSLN
eukprot:IDg21624t1